MADYRSAEELWQEVMKSQIENHGDAAAKRWKLVNRDARECVHCDEPGGGALIRCNNEKCNKYFHLDCAFHHGGFSMADSGLLTYECDTHFKHVLFCSCKQKYENTKPMVFCDECCDWFHESCEKLNSEELHNVDKYVCRKCSKEIKEGRAISQSVKDKNLEKEAKSFAHQNALKAVGLLVEIAGGACVIMDSLYGHTDEPLEIGEVESLVDFFNSVPFQVTMREGDESDGRDLDEADFMQQLGVVSLVAHWKQHATNFLDQWKAWLGEVIQTSASFAADHRIAISLDDNQMASIRRFVEALDTLDKARSWTARCSDRDLDGYNALVECAHWTKDLLQVLHQQPKTQQWSGHLAAVARNANVKAKKLNSFAHDAVCVPFIPFFQGFAEKAREASTKLVGWMEKVAKIIAREREHPLEKLEALVIDSQSFPCAPFLLNELRDLITKAKGYEEALQHLLRDNSSLEETLVEQLQQLNNQINDLGIILPSEKALGVVIDAAIYVEAFRMKGDRVSMEIANSLLAEGKKVLKSINSLAAPLPSLCVGLIEEVTQSGEVLQQALDQARTVTEAHAASLNAEISVETVHTLLMAFQQLVVIVPQEEFMLFLRDTLSLTERSADILERRVSVSLDDLQMLIDALRTSLATSSIDQFAQAAARHAALKKALAGLLALNAEADKGWAPVVTALADFGPGMAVNFEVLSDLLSVALATGVTNDAAAASVREALQVGQEKDVECLQRLEAITEASDACLVEAQRLVDIVHHHAVPKATALRVRARFEACEVVILCSQALSSSSTDLLHLRDCRHKIARLEGVLVPSSIEQQMVFTVQQPFLVYSWKVEARAVLAATHPASLGHAEKMLEAAVRQGLGVEGMTEFAELQKAVTATKVVASTCQRVAENVNELVSVKAHGADDIGALGSKALAEVLQSEAFVNVKAQAQTWLESAHPILSETQVLVGQCDSLVVGKDEETMKARDAQSKIKTQFDAMSLVCRLSSIQTMEEAFLVPDVKDLVTLVNRCAVLSESLGADALLTRMYLVVKTTLAEVNVWVEKVQALLPQRASRVRNREDARKGDGGDLAFLTNELGRRICRTPTHARAEEAWKDIALFQSKLRKVLFPSSPTVLASAPAATTFAQIRADLPRDMAALSELQNDADLIPVEIVEFDAMRWLVRLFQWYDHLPLPEDDDTKLALSLEDANRKVEQGQELTTDMPERVVKELIRLQVMTADGYKAFNSTAHPAVVRCREAFAHLQEQVQSCLAFQRDVENAIQNDFGPIELENMVLTAQALPIQPDRAIFSKLEKILQSKRAPLVSHSVTSSGRTVKKRPNEDYWEDDTSPSIAPASFAAASAPKEQRKEQRDREAAAVPSAKPTKKTKSYPCAASGCDKEVRSAQWSGFCSDTCAVRSATAMFAALCSYKKALSSSSGAPSDGPRRNDLYAFDLADGRGNALGHKPLDPSSTALSPRDKKPTMLTATMTKLPAVSQTLMTRDGFDRPTKTAKPQFPSQMQDNILRSRMRASWEEFFMQSLLRLHVNGGLVLALLLADELEEAAFRKYSGENGLDTKEYRKHHQMLSVNIRQAHNEPLVVKMASGELSADQLLAMTAQQLADPALQQRRQQQLTTAMEAAERKSTEEVLEEMRRQTMAGHESWRDRDSLAEERKAAPQEMGLAVDTAQDFESGGGDGLDSPADGLSAIASAAAPLSPSSPSSSSVAKSDGSALTSLDGNSANSQEIEDRLLASSTAKAPTVQAKRPLDADAMTRFTNPNRPKTARVEAPPLEMPREAPKPQQVESPRLKAPSLLEILKASKPAEDEASKAAKLPSSTHGAPSGYLPTMRLLGRDGSHEFTISRPGGVVMHATAMVSDRRLQAAVKSALNIDGRVRINDAERFVNEVLASNRKIIATCPFLIFHSGAPDCSYHKFCDEFTRDERCGISNVTDQIQVYVIPPGLKDRISVFSGITLSTTSAYTGPLYAFIVAKESALSAPSGPFPTLPFAVASYAVPLKLPEPAAVVAKVPLVAASVPAPAPVPVPLPSPRAAAGPTPAPAAPLPVPAAAVQTQPSPVVALGVQRPLAGPGVGGLGVGGLGVGSGLATQGFAAAPRAALSQDTMSKIRQVAKFCAEKGVAKLNSLKENPNSRSMMPFLYEGNTGFEEFMQTLKEMVYQNGTRG